MFTSGLHVVGIVSAIFYVALVILAVWALRHVQNSHGHDSDPRSRSQKAELEPEAASPTRA
ncbi:hypothetical protein [Tenggerimyces flavus]|uniref:Uncharacterized protein n=1 Tax=Tenggerimyces flavus TaxID=1708749 RepID=A0ABV7Y7P2_9ACTN|nr:hypothetical protein [Tenggerimyces flavus]MBM7790324.1 flagellar biogenesis protein FliO [Tenggerimyces flavus]